jgi:hypothetical protein
MKRYFKLAAYALALAALLAIAGTYGASYYYTSQYGKGCASCHEMSGYVSAVHGSFHRKVGCMDCHEASLGTKLRHMRVHLFGTLPEEIRLRDVDVVEMVPNCQNCHRHEYATWQIGPHSATYSDIFTNSTQNTKQHLMEDCFRCHGMHFNGSIRDLVQPLNTKGPWHLIRSGFADKPTIPCQSCHQVHRESAELVKPEARRAVAGEAINNSLAFFDRREQLHFAAAALTIPQVYDGARAVTMSQDPRQAVCYQCHAPRKAEAGSAADIHNWGKQAGSGDDRTGIGVHEGISCVACHLGHNVNARASCKTCHPKMSNCGLDVEKMDTTFASAASAHNIHWVKCEDCHQQGIPKVKTPAPATSAKKNG